MKFTFQMCVGTLFYSCLVFLNLLTLGVLLYVCATLAASIGSVIYLIENIGTWSEVSPLLSVFWQRLFGESSS